MEKTIAEIIDMAIQREDAAYDFYMDIHHKVQDASVKETVEYIAKEEIKHKEFLVGYRAGNYGSDSLRMADVVDYKIAEYLEEPEIDSDSSREEVYLIASHREARSHLFYTELAGMHADSELKTMLLKMANEELKHKEKMEYLYSNTAFAQTSGGWLNSEFGMRNVELFECGIRNGECGVKDSGDEAKVWGWGKMGEGRIIEDKKLGRLEVMWLGMWEDGRRRMMDEGRWDAKMRN